jgi:lysophospholipase
VIRYPEARHEVLMEIDDLRDRAWADIDHFLEPIVGSSAEALNRRK